MKTKYERWNWKPKICPPESGGLELISMCLVSVWSCLTRSYHDYPATFWGKADEQQAVIIKSNTKGNDGKIYSIYLPIMPLTKIKKINYKTKLKKACFSCLKSDPSIIFLNQGCSHNTWEVSMLTVTHIQIWMYLYNMYVITAWQNYTYTQQMHNNTWNHNTSQWKKTQIHLRCLCPALL